MKSELKEEAKKIMSQLVSDDVVKQLDNFDDPKKYPKDFLDECTHFLGMLVGQKIAIKKFSKLYKKYAK